MALLILTITAIICFTAYLYTCFRKRFNYFRDLGIPHLLGTLFFGNMKAVILSEQHVSDFIKRVYNVDNEAKYVGAYNFMEPVIVLRDRDLLKQVVKHIDDSQKRMDNAREAKTVKYRRVFGQVFSTAKMKVMFEFAMKKKNTLIDYIKRLAEDPEHMVEMKDLFLRYNNDLQSSFALGVDVDALNDPDNEFYKQGKKLGSLVGATKRKHFLRKAFPKLCDTLEFRVFEGETSQVFANVAHQATKVKKEGKFTWCSVMETLLNTPTEDEGNRATNKAKAVEMAFTLYFAGLDSTSTILSLLAYEIALNDDVQAKLQSEIDDTLKETDGTITFGDIDKMRYLDAVINETMRLYPSSYVQKKCEESFELPPALPGLEPLVVQRGSTFWIPIAGLQADPKNFENPDKFDPDRFLVDNRRAITSPSFGMGSNACAGKQFALFNLKIMLFYVLAEFSFRPTAKTRMPLVYDPKYLGQEAEGGIWLSFESRKK